MFLNLTNHPSSDGDSWSEEQRRAAEAIGGTIHDFGFPDVPPQASTDEVVTLAQTVAASVFKLRPSAALVQGEFTLTLALVMKLESLGIPCYAATTRRIGKKAANQNDVSTAEYYRFERFRRYVLL